MRSLPPSAAALAASAEGLAADSSNTHLMAAFGVVSDARSYVRSWANSGPMRNRPRGILRDLGVLGRYGTVGRRAGGRTRAAPVAGGAPFPARPCLA